MLRDNALMLSGLMDDRVGGHWVKPYQPAGVWKELANQIGENKYRQSRGNDLFRRSLYSYWKRTIPPPAMLTFDAAERTVCVVKRQATSTPLQSLILLNDPTYVEAARVLAEQLLIQHEDDIEGAIETVFRMATSRLPERQEQQVLLDMYHEERQRYEEEEASAIALLEVGTSVGTYEGSPATWAALTVVANTILNLEEAKHKS